MKKKNIFIILPSDIPTGPVKGAYALANKLILNANVFLVFLRKGVGLSDPLNKDIKIFYLRGYKYNILRKIFLYRDILHQYNDQENVSISMCLTADFVNIFCGNLAKSFSSVRGNLFKNYFYNMSYIGLCVAFFHILFLNFVDNVIAMSPSMSKQLNRFLYKKTITIPNFINEDQASEYMSTSVNKKGPYRFVFVGSINKRKRPILLIKALKDLKLMFDIHLDIVGTGKDIYKLEKYALDHHLLSYITFHGHLDNPLKLISQADVLVLPSKSEGFSRASLEALFLGTPVILRDIDSNYLLLELPNSGSIFRNENDLADIMASVALISRSRNIRKCLLPDKFRQSFAINSFYKIINS